MVNSNLELLQVIRGDKYDKVEVRCTLCGQTWNMWRSHFYRGDTPCDCHHWKKKYKRLYSIYTNMKSRCYNSNMVEYKHYGGRGVSICSEWLNSFVNFKEWAIANGYSDELSIERIDVNGNYEPANCKWIYSEEQARNKTTTIRVGSTCLRDWCIKHNLNYKVVHQYLKRHPELTLQQVLDRYLMKQKGELCE